MFTLGLMYVLIYLTVILSLLVLSFIHLPVQFMTQLSTTTFLVILQKYSRFKGLFLLLIFGLTGLPPVGLFFVKFNILAFVLYQTHIAAMFALFILFFLNMLFYIQPFNIKNYKTPVYSVMNPDIFSVWQQNKLNTKIGTTYRTYSLILFVVNTLMILCIMPLFFTDLFLILNLI